MQIFLSQQSVPETIRRRRLGAEDLPALAADASFDGIEISDRLLVGCSDADRRRLGQRCRDAGVGLIVDIGCDLTAGDEEIRGEEIRHVEAMLVLAAELGTDRVRLAIGGQSLSIQGLLGRRRAAPAGGRTSSGRGWKRLLSGRAARGLAHVLRKHLPVNDRGIEEKTDRAIAALRGLLPRAESLGVRMAVENHWGVTTRPENIMRIVFALESPWLGICVDFENFPQSVDRYEAIATLATRALIVHARSARFGRDGEERSIDYSRCLGALGAVSYGGPFSVEYFGGGDELEGCRRTRELLLSHAQG